MVSALGNLAAPGMATVSVISNQTLSLYINLTYKQPQNNLFIEHLPNLVRATLTLDDQIWMIDLFARVPLIQSQVRRFAPIDTGYNRC